MDTSLTNITVSLVGRPNVGKSRLFNRMTGRRISIVYDQPGVTRDVIAWDVFQPIPYTLLDTGGIGACPEGTDSEIYHRVQEQVSLAIEASQCVLFVVDGRVGFHPLDEQIAEQLRPFGKDVWLVVNKMDNETIEDKASSSLFWSFGEPFFLSAEHGRGMTPLVESINSHLECLKDRRAESLDSPENEHEPVSLRTNKDESKIEANRSIKEQGRLSLCFIGRPNVGKSTLVNTLLDTQRMVVSGTPGTTRDAVSAHHDYLTDSGKTIPLTLYDTAGLRQKKKFRSPVEYFSALRASGVLDQINVALLVLDAREGVKKYDKECAGEILDRGRPIIVLVNKWDYAIKLFREEPPEGYQDEAAFRKDYEKRLREELFFLPDSPILFVSAHRAHQTEQIVPAANDLMLRTRTDISTGQLNRFIADWTHEQAPAVVSGKRFKIFYATQTGKDPIKLKLFCNREDKLKPSYKRYLLGGLRKSFDLPGCPLELDLAGKERRYADKPALRS